MIWEVLTKETGDGVTVVTGFKLVSECDRELGPNETKEKPVLDYQACPLGYVFDGGRIEPRTSEALPEKTAEEIATEEKQKLEAEGFTPAAFADLVKRVEALEKGGP